MPTSVPRARTTPIEEALRFNGGPLARRALDILLLCTLATLVHREALHSFFALDDIRWLSAISDHSMSPTYRPLTSALMRAIYSLWGMAPAPYFGLLLAVHLINATLLYAIVQRITTAQTALFAAILFSTSPIAFTPLHWVVGLSELLATTLLLMASYFYLYSFSQGTLGYIAALACACLAVLAKETAISWFLVALCAVRSQPPRRTLLLLCVGMVAVCWLMVTVHPFRRDVGDPYQTTWSMPHGLAMLQTYLAWSISLHKSIPDYVALPDAALWPLAALFVGMVGLIIYYTRGDLRRVAALAALWFMVFLVPHTLIQHAYLYYLYIPWVGGATLLALGLERLRSTRFPWMPWLVLAAYVAFSGSHIDERAHAVEDGLPLDPVVRQALLLRNVTSSMAALHLTDGTSIGFVNPVPGPHHDLLAGSQYSGAGARTSYYPLERIVGKGEAFALYGMHYTVVGFSDTIPSSWDGVRVLLFEQRGFLRDWGSDAAARTRQAAWVDSIGQSRQ